MLAPMFLIFGDQKMIKNYLFHANIKYSKDKSKSTNQFLSALLVSESNLSWKWIFFCGIILDINEGIKSIHDFCCIHGIDIGWGE